MSGTKTINGKNGQRELDRTKSLEAVLGLDEAWDELRRIGRDLSSTLKRADSQENRAIALKAACLEILNTAVGSFNQMQRSITALKLDQISFLDMKIETGHIEDIADAKQWSYYMNDASDGLGGTQRLLVVDPVKLFETINEQGIDNKIACFFKVQFCLALHELSHVARDKFGSTVLGDKYVYANEALANFMQSVALEYLCSDVKNDEERRKIFSLLGDFSLKDISFNESALALYSKGEWAELAKSCNSLLRLLNDNTHTYGMIADDIGSLKDLEDIKSVESLENAVDRIDAPGSEKEASEDVKALIADIFSKESASKVTMKLYKRFIDDAYTVPEKLLYLAYLQSGSALPVVLKGLEVIDNNQLISFCEHTLHNLEAGVKAV